MLIGRDSDLTAIDGLLAATRARRSNALVLLGEAGIGKSALLGYAAGRADGLRVLRATGVESEAELAFATLHQLLRPLHHGIDRLSGPQASALRSAFGLAAAPTGGPDRFLVAVGALTLLADAAEERPVLCLVDDAQWVDRPSAEALLFVARRLQAEGVALLVAARDAAEPARGEAFATDHPLRDGLPQRRLGGVDETAGVALLVTRHGDRLGPSVARELAARTAGNPLALLEVPPLLTADQLAGRDALPTALPLGAELERAFLRRVGQLPPPTRRLLEVAAADDGGELDPVLRAAAPLGLADAAPAEQAGLLHVVDGRIELGHPLLRAAIYRATTAARRQEIHRALANAAGHAAPDRRAWHLARAATGPDAEAAAELEATAGRARERSGHAAAATAMTRAAELSTDEEARARRLTLAADDAWLAGQAHRAGALLDQAASIGGAADPAAIAYLRGLFQLRTGIPATAVDTLLAGAARAGGLRALEMLMTAAEAAAYAGDPGRQLEIGRLAATVPAADDGDDRVRFLRAALTGVSDMLSGDTTTGITALTAAEAIADGFDDPTYLRWAASAAVYAGSADVERRYLRLVERTRELGAVGAMPYALEFVAVVHATNGQFTDAVSEATEGLRLARDTGQDAAVGTLLAALAIVAALQGRDQECRAYADEALGLAIPRQLGITVGFAGWALALLDLGMGHPNEALERLLAVASAGPGAGHPAVSVASLGPLVDAAVWAGRPTVGRDMLNRLGPWVERTGPHYGAMLSYCRARLADGPDAAALFEETLALLHDMPQPFPLARAHLSYGQHLRRLRQRGASRVHLRAAVEGFDLIGAAPWATRARTELRATGETARQRDVSTTGQLTPQEKQIVQRVANGLSNREIGAQLFLSARTVEYHLRKVFHKLGLTSRTELIRLDLSGQLGTE